MTKKILFLIMLMLAGFLSCYDSVLDTYDNSVIYNLRDRGPAGGWIFYINPNYRQDGWRYLEAAPVSKEWMSKKWGSLYSTTGANGTAVGTGKTNTAKIVAWLDNNTDDFYGDVTNRGDRAAYLCNTLEVINNGVNYNDWFLPSNDELDLIYKNLYLAGIGNFEDAIQRVYWSSTEDTSANAYRKWLPEGSILAHDKNQDARVRAIRAF